MSKGGAVLVDAPRGTTPLLPLLGDSVAVRVREALSPERAGAWAEGALRAESSWVRDFGGAQFSLGRAWYTHLEQGRAADYFADVSGSDGRVEQWCPGLQQAMRDLARAVVGEPVVQRPGWCGPGVHVFPPGALVATRGGDVHFDIEGLTPAHVGERAPALTLVVMLQPAARGGALRVWDVRCRGTEAYADEDLERPYVDCSYGPGDLVVIDSYRMHQIQPFSGECPRVSATVHAAYVEGRWETWF